MTPSQFSVRPPARFGYIAIAISAILFSAKSVFIKMCFAQGASPGAVMALRTSFAMPCFLVMALMPLFTRRELRPPPLRRGELAAVIGLGLLGYYVASVLDIYGLVYVSAGTERLVLYVYPSLVVILSAWIFRKPIPKYLMLPLVLSYAGIALSFGSELAASPGGRPYLGGGLILLSALCYALFLVGHGKLVHRVGPQRLAAYASLAAGIGVLCQFLLTQPLHSLVQPGSVYLIAALTAVFCNVVPVYLVGYGVQAIGPGKAAIVSSVGPVSTYVLAALILGEPAGILQITGLGLVLAGTLILSGKDVKNRARILDAKLFAPGGGKVSGRESKA